MVSHLWARRDPSALREVCQLGQQAIHSELLRTPLRAGASDADLVGLLQNVWRNRTDRYSEIRGRLLEHKPEGTEKRERVEMYRMGG